MLINRLSMSVVNATESAAVQNDVPGRWGMGYAEPNLISSAATIHQVMKS